MSTSLAAGPVPLQSQPVLSRERRLEVLCCLLAVFITVPVLDIPVIGLSLSAPVLALIAMELFFRSDRSQSRSTEIWMVWGAVFWCALVVSLVGNVFQGNFESLEFGDGLTLLQWTIWVAGFLCAAVLVQNMRYKNCLTLWMGLSIVSLASLRFIELAIYQNWGSARTHFLTRNAYGLLFSVFTSFAVLLLANMRGLKRIFALGGNCVVLAAIVGNLSRGTWVAIGFSGLLATVLLVAAGQMKVRLIITLFLIAGSLTLTIPFLPESISAPILKRFATFDRMDEDKSYAMRLLMTRKGLKLFGDNPLFGAGIGRFATTEAVVEPPPTYRHIYSGRAAPYKSAHNSYVGVLGETGLAGTLPFGFLVVLLAIAGLWASYRDARIGAYDTLAIYTAFIGMSVHFGSIMGITSTMPWIVYGMLAGSITGPAAKRTAY